MFFSTFIPTGETPLPWIPRCILRPGHRSPVDSPRAPAQPASKPELTYPATANLFAKDVLQFPIDPKQSEILLADSARSRRVLVNCTRQWGKSTTAAIKALHHALTNPRSLTLVASRTLHQAGELVEKVREFARSIDLPTRRAPGHPGPSLLLPNFSRILAIPGRPGSIRGYSAVSLLIIDEAAFVPDNLYEALRPMLATTNGAIWLLSTPDGPKGFFHKEWHDHSKTWSKFCVPANECPRIDPMFLAEERRKFGPAIFDREYMCKFTSSGDTYFDLPSMQASVVPPEAKTPQHQALSGESYLATRFYVGFDLGQKSSHSAIVVLERAEVTSAERDPVYFNYIRRREIHLHRAIRLPLGMSYELIADRLRNVIELLPTQAKDVTVVVDATGCGSPFLDILRRQPLGALLMAVTITGSGLPSSSGSAHRVPKADLMQSLNYIITAPEFKVSAPAADYQAVMEELANVRFKTARQTDSPRFVSTGHDDLVMAFALAAWPARRYLVSTSTDSSGKRLPPFPPGRRPLPFYPASM